ncbi:hypothetical protein CAL7716_072290 [Calothrix sp. PCC 7716]|nr:hypothetical protein CAL7716_072290 [Calothrix sp. PCC 7716]
MSKYNFDKFKKKFRKVHNLQVQRAIKIAKDEKVKNTKLSLLTDCLIDANDTAQMLLLKSHFFWTNLGNLNNKIDAVASIPVSWVITPGSSIPQLAIVFRAKEAKRSGNYTIYIPHYNGNRNPVIKPYTKGEYGYVFECKDNSKMIIYANSHKSAEAYIKNNLLEYVDKRFLPGIGKPIKRAGIKKNTMQPYRADFYPNGASEGERPIWRHYF